MNAYEQLYQEYVRELRAAVAHEEAFLKGIRERNRENFTTEEELEIWVRRNFDPISCSGRVVAIFRKYWLACDKLNLENDEKYSEEEDVEEVDEESEDDDEEIDWEYVNPKDFTVDWLSGEHDDLYELIDSMPYYPIGIDEDGNYC
ncbi:hypothetical protein JJB07_14065 [Tumebacillus sp. ITR2]|uniref:Uncharacterized protein n=1 Tax=Tumebacillus amylolyticus TaxID=2801339 RepID=A0ABS1JBW1_9BACL|nr:hypothetical protein [Tumebacillus amylolyticus]MBL0387762.1 hypothetical protein [Tumebacillus amylolyticus]